MVDLRSWTVLPQATATMRTLNRAPIRYTPLVSKYTVRGFAQQMPRWCETPFDKLRARTEPAEGANGRTSICS